jgi:predicted Zn-dependent protease
MAVTPKRLLRLGLFSFILAQSFVVARAQDTAEPASPEIISRYEQILEREPEEGVSFDKLIQIYEQGDGLEKLDARWAPISAQGGAKGAIYSLLRGLLADRMGRTDAARTLLQAATVAAPTDYHTWLALGDFEARDGKLPAAIAAFQKGLATPVTGEDQLALFHKLGQAQERNLDDAGALATWQKMTTTFPQDTFALEEAGSAELDASQFDEARKTFQKLVDLAEPNSMARVQALMKLAGVDDREGKTDAAVHGYEAILPLTADASWLNREIRAQIEQVYRREDDLAGLATYYQKWTMSNPKDVDALLLWSGTLTELGKKDEALDALRKAAALAPDRHEVRQSLALGLVEAEKFDEAIAVETALTADDPTEPRYWETLGEALYGKTQPPTPESKKAVLDAWSHIAPADSKDVAAILQVAELCRTHQFNDEALAGYNHALAITPDATDIREKAAQLLVDLHRQDAAWKLLDAMAEGTAATSANELKLAQIDDRLGRKDASAAAIQKGLALEPGNFDLLSMEWSRLAEAQKWPEAAALYDKLLAAAPNDYFADVVQGRQAQALTSAGQLDDVEKKLGARLGGQPPLTEGELGLLTRILVQQNDDDTAEKAFAEATQRFPNSAGLLQLQVDYARHAGKPDEAVSGLRHMIALKPQQKGDYLGEIVRIRQDQQNFDEALKVAQEIIDASPASTDGYLLYSDVAFAAGKSDDGIARLQVAIKLSDKPNEVRQRLAQHEMELGQPAKARAVYDDAFAAADTPQDKLTIVRAMVPAYFQTGQIDDLIARFRQEQNSEEGGWRYGLFLSAIYDEMEDFGAARRELAKSLAVRPKDTALLHSLIDLADKGGDDAEVLRYREMLADADPSVENQRSLAEEYAQQDKPADAWRVVTANQPAIMKDPLPWKDLLSDFTDPGYAGRMRTLLETAIRAQGSTLEGQFALAQFQVQQQNLDAARESLWNILAMPLPPPPPPAKTSSSGPASGQVVFSGMVIGFNAMQMSPEFRRVQAAAMAQNEYFQLAAAAQNPGNYPSRVRMAQRMNQFGGMYGGGMAAPTALGPQEIQDHALVYLAAMAVQQNKAADFLKELEDKIAAWHWDLPQRLVAYAMIQARAPLLDAIEEQANTGKPDRDLDQFCLQESGIFQQVNGDTTLAPRAPAAQKILSDRLQKEMPQSKDQLALQKIYQSSADSSPAGLAKRQAAIHDYLATIDNKDPATVLQAIELARGIDDLDMAKQEMAVLAAMNRATWPVMMTQQLAWLPVNMAQPSVVVVPQRAGSPTGIQPPASPKVDPAARIALLLDAFELGYPAVQPPNVSMMSSSIGMQGGSLQGGGLVRMGGLFIGGGMSGNNGMMPANRYFAQDRITALQQVFGSLQQQKLVDEFQKQLADRAKKSTDWRAIYPQLMQIYVQWWADKKDAALASAREMLSEDPSDDNRRLVAWMLTEQQKYADALPLLEAVTARYGTSYIETQLQILHTARLAKDNDSGARAAQRLLALRLPQQEQMQFLDDLRAIGMQDKATEIMQHQQAMYNRNAGAQQAAVQSVRTMQDAMNRQDKNTARDLAHQLLSHDPNASNLNGNEEFATREAINVLSRLGELDAYLADIEKQLDANPGSLRLNWVAAQIYEQMPNNSRQQELTVPLPPWIKLERKGDQWTAIYSWDDITWSAPLSVTYTLPAQYYLGVAGRQDVVPFAFDQAVLTGKVGQMPLVNPATSPIQHTPGIYAIATNVPPDAPGAPPGIAGPTPSVLSFTDALQSKNHPPPPPGQMQITFSGGYAPVPRAAPTYFSFQPVEGDTALAVHQNSSGFVTVEADYAPALTAAATLDLESPQVRAYMVPPSLFVLATRGADLNEHEKGARIESRSLWLKLKRDGPVFTGWTSLDGQVWRSQFTTSVPMLGNGAAMTGFVTSCANNGKAHIDWKNVKVDGTSSSSAPPAPTPAGQPELPAPWHAALAGSPDNATAQLTGSELTMDLPGTAPLVATPSSNLVYQMLHGNGEITAQLGEISSDNCYAGLTFRAGTAPDAPSIEFYCRKDGHLGYNVQSDTTTLATKYLLKVAQMQPGNINMLVNLAQRLISGHHEAEAADIYLTLLKSDLNSALPYISQMDEAFRAAGRSKELVDLLDAWNPPPFNPMFGGGVNTQAISQLGDQMRSNGDLPNAERLYRKALSVQGPQPNDEAAASLVELLEQEGKRDEASAEIQTLLLDQDAAAPPPVLGYSYNNNNNNWGWMFGMSWNQDGPMLPAKLRLLQLDSDLGGAPKLKAALQAKLAGNTRSLINGLDPDNVMLVLLAIVSGEPDASALAEKLVKSETGGSTNISVLVAEEMSLKPAMRREAWQVLQDAVTRTGPNNGNFSLMLDNMARKIAEQIGDPALVVKTLRREIDDFQATRNANPGFINIDQEVTFIRALFAAGLKKEAVAELTLARSNPQAANKYLSDQLDALANEMGVGDGKLDVMPVAFGFSPGKSAHAVDMSWCLGLTTNNNGFDAMSQSGEWDDSVLVRPSAQTLVLQGADDQGQTFATIATFPQIATRGVMPVKLPAGVSVFRAVLLPPGGGTAPTTAQPNGPGQPGTSALTLYGTGANLLENPDLAVTKNAAGLPALTGWNGLWPDAVTEEKGGPAPDHRYRSLARFNNSGISQILSSSVPITPGTTYILSGWMRGAFNVGVYLRDAGGRQVEQRMLNGGGQNTAWKHFSCRIGTRSPGGLATINIPPNAATIQLTFQGNQTIDAALLSLRTLDPSATGAPAAGH